jgi:hypothetical protein
MIRARDLRLPEKWLSFCDGENMMRAMSMSQRTESSYAFLISPFRRLEKVTCRFVMFSILLIWSFTRPMVGGREGERGIAITRGWRETQEGEGGRRISKCEW